MAKPKPVKKAGKSIVQIAVGKVAAASRQAHRGTAVNVREGALEEARDELLAARVEVAIRDAMDPDEPYKPLSQGQRERLSEILLNLEDEDDEDLL